MISHPVMSAMKAEAVCPYDAPRRGVVPSHQSRSVDQVSRPDGFDRPGEDARRAYNRNRSLKIIARSEARATWVQSLNRAPSKAEEASWVASWTRINGEIPPSMTRAASGASPSVAPVKPTITRLPKVPVRVTRLDSGAASLDQGQAALLYVPAVRVTADQARRIMQILADAPSQGTFPRSLRNQMLAQLRTRSEAEWVAIVEAIEDDSLRLALAKRIWWDYFINPALGRAWRGLDHILRDENDWRWLDRHSIPDVDELRASLWRVGYPADVAVASWTEGFTVVTRQDVS